MKPTPAQLMMTRNRAVLAERTGWPSGILAICVHLEQRHPGWHMMWLPENTIAGFERPAGFAATRAAGTLTDADDLRPRSGIYRTPRVFAADPVELAARIAAIEERIAAEEEVSRRRREWMRQF